MSDINRIIKDILVTKYEFVDSGKTYISKPYKTGLIIISFEYGNSNLFYSQYNPILNKENQILIERLNQYFFRQVNSNNLKTDEFESHLIDFINTECEKRYIVFDNLSKFPKHSEYPYIFGEIIDHGFDMDIFYGYYEEDGSYNDNESVSDGRYDIFKLYLVFGKDTSHLELDMVDIMSELNYCVKRLSSFIDIESKSKYVTSLSGTELIVSMNLKNPIN